MKRRSLRLRLALISMGLSGLVLLVFGLVAWWSLAQSQLRSLDKELTNFGHRFASRSGPNVRGERQEEILASSLGAEAAVYRFSAILNRRGEVLFRSARWPDALDPQTFPGGSKPLDPQPKLTFPTPKPGETKPERELRLIYDSRFYTTSAAGNRYRIGVFRNADVILVTGADLNQFTQDVIQLRNAFLIALPAALAMIAFGAWWLGRKALRPIQVLEEDMSQLSARALDQRLETGEADIEFARIIETYNAMLERLERSFHQANRFSADASHELKTPLAIMRGTLERGLSKCETREDAVGVFSELLEQTGRQGAILESLLLLSRADAGKLELSSEPINLSELLETWLEDADLLAEARDISIESHIEPEVIGIGDPLLLQQVAHNLFSNAVRYNEDGGRIECSLSKTESKIIWRISNTGESISPEDQKRIFERFEQASSATDGTGLGLSLIKEIVAAHEGKIFVSENAKGMVEFEIILPPGK